MSMMCPMDGCKQKQGMCIHKKVMMAAVVLAAFIGGIYLATS